MTILDRVRGVLAEQADVPIEKVLPGSGLDDLGLDSLDVVEASMALEEEFKLEIPTKELQNWNKVADVVLYLDRVIKELPEVEA